MGVAPCVIGEVYLKREPGGKIAMRVLFLPFHSRSMHEKLFWVVDHSLDPQDPVHLCRTS